MDDDWAQVLKERGIKFEEYHDKILFYDPKESPGHVVIREHTDNDMDLNGYKSRRIGYMSFEEFKKLPDAVRYNHIVKYKNV